MPDQKLTFENLPKAIETLLEKVNRIESALFKDEEEIPLPPYISVKQAAELAGTTANALRIKISTGKLKGFHRGSRIYIDTQYFKRWLLGEEDAEIDPREILKK